MNKILKIVPILLVVVLLFAGCGSPATYEEVYNEYSVKLKEESPKLVKEFNDEAAALNGDITKLAELSTKKIEKLAEISTEGISEMAKIQTQKGDDYSVYQDWATKLTKVYEEEAQKITDAYMSKAIN